MSTAHRARALGASLALAALVAFGIAAPRTAQAADTVAAAAAYPAVTDDRLVNAQTDDGWLMFRRSYDSRGYAPFDQIGKQNVAQLKPVFTYASGLKQGHEAAPVVNGRYHVRHDADGPPDRARRDHRQSPLDLRRQDSADRAQDGLLRRGQPRRRALRRAWSTWRRSTTTSSRFDAPTGRVLWNKRLAAPGVGYAMTAAPLIVGGQVVTGIAGGEFGARGFILALDARTGAQNAGAPTPFPRRANRAATPGPRACTRPAAAARG